MYDGLAHIVDTLNMSITEKVTKTFTKLTGRSNTFFAATARLSSLPLGAYGALQQAEQGNFIEAVFFALLPPLMSKLGHSLETICGSIPPYEITYTLNSCEYWYKSWAMSFTAGGAALLPLGIAADIFGSPDENGYAVIGPILLANGIANYATLPSESHLRITQNQD